MKESAFLKLIADIKSNDPEKQESAANQICGVIDTSILPKINSVLDSDPDPLVQRVMLWSLRKYPGKLSFEKYLRFLSSEDDGVREAATVLFMEGEKPASDVLIAAVKGDNKSDCYAAVQAFGQFRDEAAVEPLLYAAQLPDAELREIAVMSLGIYPGEAVCDALIDALKDEPAVRLAALSGLKGRSLSQKGYKKVLYCLGDKDEDVRAAAVYVLDAHVPDSAASDASERVRRAVASVSVSPKVIEKLCTDTDSSVRTAAAESAGKLHLQIDDVLIYLLKDEVPGVRRAAATALGHSESVGAVAALISALSDSKPGIRAAAAASLGAIGGDEAVAALRKASNVSNPILAGMIKNALEIAERKMQH